MYDINKIILKCINKLCPNKRLPKYTNSYYLKLIQHVCKTGCQWNQLICECHHTSVYKTFCKWTANGVFEKAYEKLRSLFMIDNKYKDPFKLLIIDSCIIKNNKGSDKIGYHHKEKSKKGTKISVIIDSNNRFPLAINIESANVHDLTETIPCIEKLPSELINDRRKLKTIIADKGYIMGKENKLIARKKYRVKVLTPLKSNSIKNKLHSRDISILRKRNRIEPIFSWIKQYRRLCMRYDVWSKYFLSFVYMGFMNANKNANKVQLMHRVTLS
jgi:transposase